MTVKPVFPFLLLTSYLFLQAAVTAGTHTLPFSPYNSKGNFSVQPSSIHLRKQCRFQMLTTLDHAAVILRDTLFQYSQVSLSIPSLPHFPSSSLSSKEEIKEAPFVWTVHVMRVCGGALDEKHNLQCPRLQRSANPGWPVQIGAAVMLVS